MLAGLLVLAAGCRLAPSSVDVERAELGEPPGRAACEAAARRHLAQAGVAREVLEALQFAPLHHGCYRVDALHEARFAWLLEATAASGAGRGAVRFEFYFLHDQLVAFGSAQPHHNRTTVSDRWVVSEFAGGGLPGALAGL